MGIRKSSFGATVLKGIPIKSFHLEQVVATLLHSLAKHQEPELEAISCHRFAVGMPQVCHREQVLPLAQDRVSGPQPAKVNKKPHCCRLAIGKKFHDIILCYFHSIGSKLGAYKSSPNIDWLILYCCVRTYTLGGICFDRALSQSTRTWMSGGVVARPGCCIQLLWIP